MKHTVQKKVLQLLQKTAEKEVKRLDAESAETEWPPNCSFLVHQPKRPGRKTRTNKD